MRLATEADARRYVEDVGAFGVNVSAVTRLEGGVSSDIFLVSTSTGQDLVVKQAVPNLKVVDDWPSDPSRVHREAAAMKWLNSVLPRDSCPGLISDDEVNQIVVMEAVARPHVVWKAELLREHIEMRRVQEAGHLLGLIHAAGARNLEVLEALFGSEDYFSQLRLEPYYEHAATTVPEVSEFLLSLVSDVREHRLTFVHGDYSPKNILLRPTGITLLDHEVAHIGDPAFDIGFFLAHFLSKANHLPRSRNEFRKAALRFLNDYRIALHGSDWGSMFESRCARHLLGCVLARVAGKSRLDYLTPSQSDVQLALTVTLINRGEYAVDEVVSQFIEGLP